MITVKMKKVRLIIARSDFECVLHELMSYGNIEVTDPDELPDESDLNGITVRETVALNSYKANYDSITLLGTQYTLLMTGWITGWSEPEFISQMSKFVCAWEIESPSPQEREKIPVALRWPKLFGIFYARSGKPFNPLKNVQRSATGTPEVTED